MPWIRLSDDVDDDARTLHAARQLGPNGLGRVFALLVELHAVCNRGLTDGHVDALRVKYLKGDRRPADVLFAMALPLPSGEPGWLEADGAGGFVIVEYLKHQPSRARVLAQRAKDATRKARARQTEISAAELHAELRRLAAAAYAELSHVERQQMHAGRRFELVERVKTHAARALLPYSGALVGRAVDAVVRGAKG
jgi:hypothetical protein